MADDDAQSVHTDESLRRRDTRRPDSPGSSRGRQSSDDSRRPRHKESPRASDMTRGPDQTSRSYSARDMVESEEVSSRASYDSRPRGKKDRRSPESRYSDDSHRDRRRERSTSRGRDSGRDSARVSRSYTASEYTHTRDRSSDRGSGSETESYDHSRSEAQGRPADDTRKPVVRPAKYEGDISAWGRKKVQANSNSESDYTLSSGLSPRDEEQQPMDIDAAKRALAYNAGMYGRAQAMRRDGTAPKTMGIADDLPNRFAFEQLNTLAGMASKVQAAIEHNRKVFEQRVRLEDRAILKKAFDAWRAARYGSIAKQQLLRRAVMRIQRGTLARAFLAWKDKFGLVDKYHAMRKKVTATIRRGLVKRTFKEWRRLCVERQWKNQLHMCHSQIHMLEKKVDGFHKRPIVVLRRRKLYAIMEAWFNASEGRRKGRLRREKAVMHWKNMNLIKAWNSWHEFYTEALRRRNLLKKAAARIKNLNLINAWNKWYELLEEKYARDNKTKRALKFWMNAALSKVWNQWTFYTAWRKEKKKIISRWMQPMKAKAFSGWRESIEWMRRMRLILDRAGKKLMFRQLYGAWERWWEVIHARKNDAIFSTKEQLVIKVKELGEENERLRRDNERFVRLIDSGEWGRGRVAELVAAGEIMKGERDALMKLIQSLRREYEAVQNAKNSQDDELRQLKERMLLGGAARNRMLVKGGSSFNALVRAMKQDLVEGGPGAGAAARDPNVMYQVDKLSLDHVTVFPDGELNVQALASSPASAAFARPISAGRGLRTTAGPVQPMRMPQGLTNLGAGPPRPATGAAGGRPGRTQDVVNFLQSLSPAELDNVEAAFRAEKAAAGRGLDPGRPPGLASTAPGRR